MKMKETLKRTRWIWAVTYAFVAGMSVGRHDNISAFLYVLGGSFLFFWVSRQMDGIHEAGMEQGKCAGTVTVKIEADTAQATDAIEALRDHALRAKRDIDAAFRPGEQS